LYTDNYDSLATHYDRIVAVDWPGMGCSSRTATQFPLATALDTLKATLCMREPEREKHIAQAVTDELIDSLEKLRVEEDLPRFTLAGHSLGGYLAAKYAVKYPDAVESLVLISPVGIPQPPPVEHQMPPAELDWRLRTISQLWRWSFTPQGIVRIVGPRGPGLVTSVVNRRFGNRWSGEPLQLVSDYFYHITAAPASGEHVLSALLEPVFLRSDRDIDKAEEGSADAVVAAAAELNTAGTPEDDAAALKSRRKTRAASKARSGVFAKLPVEDELCKLKVPILLLYGDTDWLYYPTAEQSVQKWRAAGVPAAALGIVSNAGHHLYLDNAPEFNRAVLQWAQKTENLQKA
jgi:cardiolipin-specific phospholipase